MSNVSLGFWPGNCLPINQSCGTTNLRNVAVLLTVSVETPSTIEPILVATPKKKRNHHRDRLWHGCRLFRTAFRFLHDCRRLFSFKWTMSWYIEVPHPNAKRFWRWQGKGKKPQTRTIHGICCNSTPKEMQQTHQPRELFGSKIFPRFVHDSPCWNSPSTVN